MFDTGNAYSTMLAPAFDVLIRMYTCLGRNDLFRKRAVAFIPQNNYFVVGFYTLAQACCQYWNVGIRLMEVRSYCLVK